MKRKKTVLKQRLTALKLSQSTLMRVAGERRRSLTLACVFFSFFSHSLFAGSLSDVSSVCRKHKLQLLDLRSALSVEELNSSKKGIRDRMLASYFSGQDDLEQALEKMLANPEELLLKVLQTNYVEQISRDPFLLLKSVGFSGSILGGGEPSKESEAVLRSLNGRVLMVSNVNKHALLVSPAVMLQKLHHENPYWQSKYEGPDLSAKARTQDVLRGGESLFAKIATIALPKDKKVFFGEMVWNQFKRTWEHYDPQQWSPVVGADLPFDAMTGQEVVDRYQLAVEFHRFVMTRYLGDYVKQNPGLAVQVKELLLAHVSEVKKQNLNIKQGLKLDPSRIEEHYYLISDFLAADNLAKLGFAKISNAEKLQWLSVCERGFGLSRSQKIAQNLKLASFASMAAGIIASAAPVIGRVMPKRFMVYAGVSSAVLQLVSHAASAHGKFRRDKIQLAYHRPSPIKYLFARAGIAADIGLGFLYAGLSGGAVFKFGSYIPAGSSSKLSGGIVRLVRDQLDDSVAATLLFANIAIPTYTNVRSYQSADINPLTRPRFYAWFVQDLFTSLFMAEPGLNDKVKVAVKAKDFVAASGLILKTSMISSGAAFLISNHAENMIGYLPFEKNDPISSDFEYGYTFSGVSVGLKAGYITAAIVSGVLVERASKKLIELLPNGKWVAGGLSSLTAEQKLKLGNILKEVSQAVLIFPYDYAYADFFSRSKVTYMETPELQKWPLGVLQSHWGVLQNYKVWASSLWLEEEQVPISP